MHAKKALICEGLGWGRLPLHFVNRTFPAASWWHDSLSDLSLPDFLTKLTNRPLGPVGKRIWTYFL